MKPWPYIGPVPWDVVFDPADFATNPTYWFTNFATGGRGFEGTDAGIYTRTPIPYPTSGAAATSPFMSVQDAAGPIWRVAEWHLTFALTFTNREANTVNAATGTAYLKPFKADRGAGRDIADETDLPFVIGVDTDTSGRTTVHWNFSAISGSPSLISPGTDTNVDRSEVYCELFSQFAMAKGQMAQAQLAPIIAIPCPGDPARSGLASDPSGNIDYDVAWVGVDATSDATLSVNAGSLFPGHNYTVNLRWFDSSGGIHSPFINHLSGTVTVVPSLFWGYGGKYDTATGVLL